jgi:hypothetical protein
MLFGFIKTLGVVFLIFISMGVLQTTVSYIHYLINKDMSRKGILSVFYMLYFFIGVYFFSAMGALLSDLRIRINSDPSSWISYLTVLPLVISIWYYSNKESRLTASTMLKEIQRSKNPFYESIRLVGMRYTLGMNYFIILSFFYFSLYSSHTKTIYKSYIEGLVSFIVR